MKCALSLLRHRGRRDEPAGPAHAGPRPRRAGLRPLLRPGQERGRGRRPGRARHRRQAPGRLRGDRGPRPLRLLHRGGGGDARGARRARARARARPAPRAAGRGRGRRPARRRHRGHQRQEHDHRHGGLAHPRGGRGRHRAGRRRARGRWDERLLPAGPGGRAGGRGSLRVRRHADRLPRRARAHPQHQPRSRRGGRAATAVRGLRQALGPAPGQQRLARGGPARPRGGRAQLRRWARTPTRPSRSRAPVPIAPAGSCTCRRGRSSSTCRSPGSTTWRTRRPPP